MTLTTYKCFEKINVVGLEPYRFFDILYAYINTNTTWSDRC